MTCGRRFVSRFSVHSTAPGWQGTTGPVGRLVGFLCLRLGVGVGVGECLMSLVMRVLSQQQRKDRPLETSGQGGFCRMFLLREVSAVNGMQRALLRVGGVLRAISFTPAARFSSCDR